MLTHVLRPQKASDLLGQTDAWNRALHWWQSGVCLQKPLILVGPHGCGKTSLPTILATTVGANLVSVRDRVGNNDLGDSVKYSMQQCAKDAFRQKGLGTLIQSSQKSTQKPLQHSPQHTLVFVDDLDSLEASEKKGVAQMRGERLIFACRDLFQDVTASMKKSCVVVQMRPLGDAQLRQLVEKATPFLPSIGDHLDHWIRVARGDARRLLTQAQFECRARDAGTPTARGDALVVRSAFDCVIHCFKNPTTDADQMKRRTSDMFMLSNFVLENYPNFCQSTPQLATCADLASTFDLFDGREQHDMGHLSQVFLCAHIPRASHHHLTNRQVRPRFPKMLGVRAKTDRVRKQWRKLGGHRQSCLDTIDAQQLVMKRVAKKLRGQARRKYLEGVGATDKELQKFALAQ